MASSADRPAVVVLAAGQGTRMRSSLHKVLHPVAGRPMLAHVLRAARGLDPARLVVVVGHEAEQVRAAFPDPDIQFVTQERLVGTGDAFVSARTALEGHDGPTVVLYGDQPLTDRDTVTALVREQRRREGMVLLSYDVEDPHGLGRVLRDADGAVLAIREEKDANEAERAIREVWPGVLALDPDAFRVADGLTDDNAAGEFYLTQIVDLYRAAGKSVHAFKGSDAMRLLVGVNTRAELAKAEGIMRALVRDRWLAAGVSMAAPQTTYIDDSVRLSADVTLEPGVLLRGATVVGEGATIGAYAVLDDCVVEAGATVPAHTVASARTFA